MRTKGCYIKPDRTPRKLHITRSYCQNISPHQLAKSQRFSVSSLSPYHIFNPSRFSILARDMHLATTKICHNILKKTIRSWSDPKTGKGSRRDLCGRISMNTLSPVPHDAYTPSPLSASPDLETIEKHEITMYCRTWALDSQGFSSYTSVHRKQVLISHPIPLSIESGFL